MQRNNWPSPVTSWHLSAFQKGKQDMTFPTPCFPSPPPQKNNPTTTKNNKNPHSIRKTKQNNPHLGGKRKQKQNGKYKISHGRACSVQFWVVLSTYSSATAVMTKPNECPVTRMHERHECVSGICFHVTDYKKERWLIGCAWNSRQDYCANVKICMMPSLQHIPEPCCWVFSVWESNPNDTENTALQGVSATDFNRIRLCNGPNARRQQWEGRRKPYQKMWQKYSWFSSKSNYTQTIL